MKIGTSRLQDIARRFRADRSGIGAVEFAMIAPFLFLLYLGGTELTIAITVDRKVEHTASTVNDLVTQATTLAAADFAGIYRISKALLSPYSTTGLKIRVTSVRIDDKGKATVDWSCPTTGMAKLGKGVPYTLPGDFAGLRERNLIVAETLYPYSPITTKIFASTFEMGSTSYLEPRIGNTVVSDGCTSVSL